MGDYDAEWFRYPFVRPSSGEEYLSALSAIADYDATEPLYKNVPEGVVLMSQPVLVCTNYIAYRAAALPEDEWNELEGALSPSYHRAITYGEAVLALATCCGYGGADDVFAGEIGRLFSYPYLEKLFREMVTWGLFRAQYRRKVLRLFEWTTGLSAADDESSGDGQPGLWYREAVDQMRNADRMAMVAVEREYRQAVGARWSLFGYGNTEKVRATTKACDHLYAFMKRLSATSRNTDGVIG